MRVRRRRLKRFVFSDPWLWLVLAVVILSFYVLRVIFKMHDAGKDRKMIAVIFALWAVIFPVGLEVTKSVSKRVALVLMTIFGAVALIFALADYACPEGGACSFIL